MQMSSWLLSVLVQAPTVITALVGLVIIWQKKPAMGSIFSIGIALYLTATITAIPLAEYAARNFEDIVAATIILTLLISCFVAIAFALMFFAFIKKE